MATLHPSFLKGRLIHPSGSRQEGSQPAQTHGVRASSSTNPRSAFTLKAQQRVPRGHVRPAPSLKELSLVGETGQKAHT